MAKRIFYKGFSKIINGKSTGNQREINMARFTNGIKHTAALVGEKCQYHRQRRKDSTERRTSTMVKRRFEIDAESLPDLPGMMLVTIEVLKDLGGSATIQELDEKVIELEGVTEAEQAFTMPDENRARVSYYLAWARTYLKRGNALENSSRGVWTLTESGASDHQARRNPCDL